MTKSTGKRRGVHTLHTKETLYAKCEEEGECLLWKGYVTNKVPMVFHGGKMISVRKLLRELAGAQHKPGDHYSTKCQNPDCVAEEHISHRTRAQHSRAMAKAPARKRELRAAKLSAWAREHRAKINMDIAREIRTSDETGPILADRYGINRSLVSLIRRGMAWKEARSPFSGLGAR